MPLLLVSSGGECFRAQFDVQLTCSNMVQLVIGERESVLASMVSFSRKGQKKRKQYICPR